MIPDVPKDGSEQKMEHTCFNCMYVGSGWGVPHCGIREWPTYSSKGGCEFWDMYDWNWEKTEIRRFEEFAEGYMEQHNLSKKEMRLLIMKILHIPGTSKLQLGGIDDLESAIAGYKNRNGFNTPQIRAIIGAYLSQYQGIQEAKA